MTTLSVLIVDDELGMRLGAERSLLDYFFKLDKFDDEINFKTTLVENGNDAIKILAEKNTDIILLDYKLPDILGLDILNKIKTEKYDLLTIMITAYASLDVAISATKSGAFDFLAKPFTPEELRNTVKKAAEHIYLNRKASKLEEEKKKIRFQFISVLAHELKSPLSAVENYLLLMKDKISGDNISSYENMIGRSIKRIDGMRKLIIDLLDLTRLESGAKNRVFEELSIYEIVNDAVEGVMLTAKEKNITINFNCEKNFMFYAVKDEIEIIINNLLTNAVKYNKENGSVDLNIFTDNDNVRIVCKDTGIGMTKEETSRLFNEFVRIKNEKTKNILGSGLGLSILKRIINLYDGVINVDSEPDIGTTFDIILKKQ